MKFNIIYGDPPWTYEDSHCQGAAANHYKTMNLTNLKAIPVKDIVAKDAVLFLWCTYPMLEKGMAVIKAWGFKYKSIAFQWIKLNPKSLTPVFGLGRWTRGNTEPCLLATKGHPHRVSNSISQLIITPREKHSKKPDIVRDKIVELMGDLPRIELFAREKTPGWEAIGNEIDGKDVFDALKEIIRR